MNYVIMEGLLKEIVDAKKDELARLKYELPLKEIKNCLRDVEPCRDFLFALSESGKRIALIGEIKKRSPLEGILIKDLRVRELAEKYELAGASAISVITERNFFYGDPEYIKMVKDRVKIPVLRKDFLIDEYHIYESRLIGADAILCIVSILEDSMLSDFMSLSSELSMASLVEIHDEWELERALKAGARIIGINNRDLKSFKVDVNTTLRIIKEVPAGIIVVSESGIRTKNDVKKLIDVGVKAILVGEAIVTAEDMEEKIKELVSI